MLESIGMQWVQLMLVLKVSPMAEVEAVRFFVGTSGKLLLVQRNLHCPQIRLVFAGHKFKRTNVWHACWGQRARCAGVYFTDQPPKFVVCL